jgi:hypothetical protein
VVTESHQRAPVGSLTLTRLVIGTSVYHNLHALEAGMGNGFMTCKTKRSRISSAGDRTHRMNFVLFQLHTHSLSPLLLSIVTESSTLCMNIPILKPP